MERKEALAAEKRTNIMMLDTSLSKRRLQLHWGIYRKEPSRVRASPTGLTAMEN